MRTITNGYLLSSAAMFAAPGETGTGGAASLQAKRQRNARLKALKALAETEKVDISHVTDDAIMAIDAANHEQPGPDRDLNVLSSLIDAEPVHHDAAEGEGVVTEKLPMTQSVAGPYRSRAVEVGNTLGADKAFSDDVIKIEAAKDTLSIGPLVFYDHLVRIYGGTEKAMQVVNGGGEHPGWPIAGTASTDRTVAGVVIKASNNPDRFQVQYTKDDGSTGTRNTTFYAEAYDATPHGRHLVNEMNRLNSCKADGSGDPEYARWTPAARNQYKARINGWRTTSINNLRRCRRIFGQLATLKDTGIYRVEIARQVDANTGKLGDKLLVTPRPMIVGLEADWSHAELFSIGTFLTWKPELLKEKTLYGLKQTAKLKGANNTTPAGTPLNLKIQEGNDFALKAINAFDNSAWVSQWDAQMKKPENAHHLANWYELKEVLNYKMGEGGEFHKAAMNAALEVRKGVAPEPKKTGTTG